jgi:hypothetical protein
MTVSEMTNRDAAQATTPPKGADWSRLRSRGSFAGRAVLPSPLTSGTFGHTSSPVMAGSRPKRLPAMETTCEEARVQTKMNKHITHGSAAGVTQAGDPGGGRAVWQNELRAGVVVPRLADIGGRASGFPPPAGALEQHAGRAVLVTACKCGLHARGGRPNSVHPFGPTDDGQRRGGLPTGVHPIRPTDDGHGRGGRPNSVHPIRPTHDGQRGGRPQNGVHPIRPTDNGHRRGGLPTGVHPIRPTHDGHRRGGRPMDGAHPIRPCSPGLTRRGGRPMDGAHPFRPEQ